MRSFKDLAALAGALLLPLAAALTWQFHNTQLPVADATSFIAAAVDSARLFLEEHYLQGFFNMYEERGWRPISFNFFAVPFLVMSHGNLMFACYAVSILCLCADVIYVYCLMRLRLDRTGSALSAGFIGLLPWLLFPQGFWYFSEVALFPAVFGGIYHYIRSEHLRHKQHAVGFTLLLALCVTLRPVESVLCMLPVLTFCLIHGISHKIYSAWKVAATALTLSGAVLILLFRGWQKGSVLALPFVKEDAAAYPFYMHLLMLSCFATGACLLITVLLYFSRWRSQEQKNYLLPSFAAVGLLVVLWYYPAISALFEWVYRTSIGDVAGKGTMFSQLRPLSEAAKYMFVEMGPAPLTGMVLLTVCTLIILPLRQTAEITSSFVFRCLLLTFPLPLFLYFFTVQGVTRKLGQGLTATFMACLMLILAPGRLWKVRFTLVLMLAAVQAAGMLETGMLPVPSRFTAMVAGGELPPPITTDPNPHNLMRDFIKKNYDYRKSIGLEFASVALAIDTLDRKNDPFLLALMINVERWGFEGYYPYIPAFDEHSVNRINRKDHPHGAILLVNPHGPLSSLSVPQAQKAAEPMMAGAPKDRLMGYLIVLLAKHSLAAEGLELGNCFIIDTVNRQEGCMLYYTR